MVYHWAMRRPATAVKGSRGRQLRVGGPSKTKLCGSPTRASGKDGLQQRCGDVRVDWRAPSRKDNGSRGDMRPLNALTLAPSQWARGEAGPHPNPLPADEGTGNAIPGRSHPSPINADSSSGPSTKTCNARLMARSQSWGLCQRASDNCPRSRNAIAPPPELSSTTWRASSLSSCRPGR